MENTIINGYVIGPGADLEGANLSFADFSESNLEGANLKNATISYCKSKFVNFKGAILDSAKFLFSNVEFSDFSNTTGQPIFENSNINGIIYRR